MKYLVDSNALLWLLLDPGKLSTRAREAVQSLEADLFLSVASVWELEIKRAKGKLDLPRDWVDVVQQHGMTELAIRSADARISASLPRHHGDPFDRMIVAQALAFDLTLVTRDIFLATYGVRVLAA